MLPYWTSSINCIRGLLNLCTYFMNEKPSQILLSYLAHPVIEIISFGFFFFAENEKRPKRNGKNLQHGVQIKLLICKLTTPGEPNKKFLTQLDTHLRKKVICQYAPCKPQVDTLDLECLIPSSSLRILRVIEGVVLRF